MADILKILANIYDKDLLIISGDGFPDSNRENHNHGNTVAIYNGGGGGNHQSYNGVHWSRYELSPWEKVFYNVQEPVHHLAENDGDFFPLEFIYDDTKWNLEQLESKDVLTIRVDDDMTVAVNGQVMPIGAISDLTMRKWAVSWRALYQLGLVGEMGMSYSFRFYEHIPAAAWTVTTNGVKETLVKKQAVESLYILLFSVLKEDLRHLPLGETLGRINAMLEGFGWSKDQLPVVSQLSEFTPKEYERYESLLDLLVFKQVQQYGVELSAAVGQPLSWDGAWDEFKALYDKGMLRKDYPNNIATRSLYDANQALFSDLKKAGVTRELAKSFISGQYLTDRTVARAS